MNKYVDFYKSLPVRSSSTDMWGKYLDQIKDYILKGNIAGFKNWPPIRSTMFAGSPTAGFTGKHYKILTERPNWVSRWKDPIKTEFTSNTVNHVYYLTKFEDFTNISIEEVECIFEFGAGFGNMCRLIHSMGFKGEYIIFDFPELLTLQKFYLEENNVPIDKIKLICDMGQIPKLVQDWNKSLIISTHALEEAPAKVMDTILSYVDNFFLFLFAFSGGKGKFEDFVKDNNIKHKLEEFTSMKGHFTIVGMGKK